MTRPAAVLAIETSQRSGGVAVRDGAGSTDVEMLRGRQRSGDDLLPAIDRLLRRMGLGAGDLRGVGVSIGPGGFTGLRIAISTAKMLGEALGADLVAVPSALVAAETHGAEPGADAPLIVTLAAKRSTFWCAPLRRRGDRWVEQSPAGLIEAASFDPAGAAAVLADEHLPAEARHACEQAGVAVHLPSFDPRALLRVTLGHLERRETIDPLALLPLYPRPPEAVTLWHARALRGGRQHP